MDPSIWGSCLWKTLHLIAKSYPEKPSAIDIKNYKAFFENFWKVLPCYVCSENYQRHLMELPIDDFLDNPKKLFEWTVVLHNVVNTELGKKTWTLQEAIDHFNTILNIKEKKTSKLDFKYQWILIIIILCLLGYILYIHRGVRK